MRKNKDRENPASLSVVSGGESFPQINPNISDHIGKRRKKDFSVKELFKGIREGNIGQLGMAITLIESSHQEHQLLAQELVEQCLPFSGNSVRIGITGVPGAGKSTFIESIGCHIVSEKNKLAVLAVDPSSGKSNGSILGDKTRMERLVSNPFAFIRPSPSGSSMGGVARKTRESVILCEAAGFQTIFIETVGVGQSETAVHSMTDFFLLLIIPGAGDELQGMKRGIVEMADAILVNKADGSNHSKALQAKTDYSAALHLLPSSPAHWIPPVLTCSSISGEGISEVWDMINEYVHLTRKNNYFYRRRKEQTSWWLKETILESLGTHFYRDPRVKERLAQIKIQLESSRLSPFKAAQDLLKEYYGVL